MASVKCSKCHNSIRYHGEPCGIEFVMISSENWERIIVSEFNPKIKEYIDNTSCPKLYRTDTIEDDFPGMIIKYWKCNECGSIMFFDGQNRLKEIYSEDVNYEGILEDGKEYIVFDDYTWDKITEAALPVSSLQEEYIDNKHISLCEKCLIIKDKENNIEKIYADKIMYGPDGKSVIKMTWESFKEYQRWNEFPELEENPPMTDDFMFWYKGEKYFCAGEDYGHIITDADWNRLAYNKNFLELLLTPIFEGKSFKDIIEDILMCE